MWARRVTAVVVLAIVASVGGVVPAARAQTPGDPIFGDVDGDGYRDRIFLGTIDPDRCSVIVEYGRPKDVLLPPVAYAYLRPGGTDFRCPDIGVAVNLNLGNTVDELAVAWSGGPPATITQNLLVLGRNFMPAFGIATFVSRPRYVGKLEFNADGRPDVYALSSRDRGLETYYSLGNGTLTLGPLRWCATTVEPEFRDFNKDGAFGAIITYTDACTDGSNGIVRVRADGDVTTFQRDPAGVRTWQAKVAYVNGDNWADVRTQATDTREVEYFIQIPDGSANFVKSPRATYDRVTIPDSRTTAIDVLGNDYATTAARVSILERPRYGTIQVTSDRRIVYRPNASHGLTDQFVYQITEGTRRSKATVKIHFAE